MQQSCTASDQQCPVLAYGKDTPAWLPSQLESSQDYSVATDLRQWTVVSCIFDVVLYAVKVVVSFCKVQYAHIKLRCGVMCTVFVSYSPSWAYFCQALAKLDDIWLSYRKYKKGDVFFWDTVYRIEFACFSFYRAMLRSTRLCHSMSSARDVGRVPWSSAIAVILCHRCENQRTVCNFSIWTFADVGLEHNRAVFLLHCCSAYSLLWCWW